MITLGPIIGAIKNETVRILVEFDQGGDQVITLLGKVTKLTKSVRVQANRPAIFVIDGLSQGQLYKIQYQGQEIGSFKTINQNTESELRFGVISCNSIKITNTLSEKKQLWRELQERIQKQEKGSELDFLLHIGDQLYVDYGYWEGKKDNPLGEIEKECEGKSQEEWDVEKCREIIRREYRKCWSYPPTQYVLSHIPSRMILDDHEIQDDAGKDKDLQDPDHWKGWYSQNVARFVYYEYQKQLVEDINFDDFSNQTEEYQIWTEKNSGFFTIDNRGHYLWHGDYGKNDSYLGQNQKQAFLDCLKPNGLFRDKKSIFITSTIPMILFSERITKAAKISTNDMTQHWIYSNKYELIEILDALRVWKEEKEGRVVTLIGGDIHIGGHHDIYYNAQPMFKQLITSSMANVVYTRFLGLVFEISSEIHEVIGNGYTFEKHDFVTEYNNYGIVEVRDNEELGHIVNMGLVSSKNNKPEKFWDNRTWQRKTGGGSCCNIF